MKINYEVYSSDANTQTYGGEQWLSEHWELKEYGINIGDISIDGITPEQMVSLACEMVNHLAVNGHDFELANSQDGHPKLKYLGQ